MDERWMMFIIGQGNYVKIGMIALSNMVYRITHRVINDHVRQLLNRPTPRLRTCRAHHDSLDMRPSYCGAKYPLRKLCQKKAIIPSPLVSIHTPKNRVSEVLEDRSIRTEVQCHEVAQDPCKTACGE